MLDLFRRAAPRELVAQRTVADLDAASDAFAAALLDRGFLFGDRLAVAVRDAAARATGLLGAWKAGGSVVLADPAISAEELVALLTDSGATALLADDAPDTVVASTGTVVHIVVATDRLHDLLVLHAGEKPLASEPGPDDPAVRVWPDGTHTHRALASAGRLDLLLGTTPHQNAKGLR